MEGAGQGWSETAHGPLLASSCAALGMRGGNAVGDLMLQASSFVFALLPDVSQACQASPECIYMDDAAPLATMQATALLLAHYQPFALKYQFPEGRRAACWRAKLN